MQPAIVAKLDLPVAVAPQRGGGGRSPRPCRSQAVASATVRAGLLFALFLGAVAGCDSSADAADDDDQVALQRDADALRALGITGVQARLVLPDDRQLIATSGVADLATNDPVSPEGYFRIGSTTKAFVATVVLQLVGDDQISLDDTVESWLPGLVQRNGNDGSAITIHHLLQHRSGIIDDYPPMGTPDEYYQNRNTGYTPDEIVARAMAQPPEFEPGEGWGYANTNYVLLGMIIERATGRPWYSEVEDRITTPLGLDRTIWPGTSPEIPEPHAKGYELFPGETDLVDVTRLTDADASGGILSTTADINQFFRALLGGRLLRPRELQEMQTTVAVSADVEQFWPGAGDGLGLFSRPLSCGGVYWGHSGDQMGYMTRVGATDDGRRSVVISVSTEMQDTLEHVLLTEGATGALIDHALCGRAASASAEQRAADVEGGAQKGGQAEVARGPGALERRLERGPLIGTAAAEQTR
jgi:D-alanyl-D-alanine carboxypeptidase